MKKDTLTTGLTKERKTGDLDRKAKVIYCHHRRAPGGCDIHDLGGGDICGG